MKTKQVLFSPNLGNLGEQSLINASKFEAKLGRKADCKINGQNRVHLETPSPQLSKDRKKIV
jgi:hypothetical protein